MLSLCAAHTLTLCITGALLLMRPKTEGSNVSSSFATVSGGQESNKQPQGHTPPRPMSTHTPNMPASSPLGSSGSGASHEYPPHVTSDPGLSASGVPVLQSADLSSIEHSAQDAAPLKYSHPGGDTLSDFVTLVCQEANNSQQHHNVSIRWPSRSPLLMVNQQSSQSATALKSPNKLPQFYGAPGMLPPPPPPPTHVARPVAIRTSDAQTSTANSKWPPTNWA